MSLNEIKVLHLGVHTDRNEAYSPKDFFKSPIQAARW